MFFRFATANSGFIYQDSLKRVYIYAIFNYFITKSNIIMEFKDTKLINFLRSFSVKELIEFENYLEFSYRKAGRNLVPFLKILKKFYPEFSSPDFTEQVIFKKLNPGKSLNVKKDKDTLRTLSSSLMKAVEDFICMSNLDKDKVLKNRILLGEMLERNLAKHFKQYVKTAEEDLMEDEKNNTYNILENYHLEKLNSGYFLSVSDFDNFILQNYKSLEFISAQFWIELLNVAKLTLLSQDVRSKPLKNDLFENLINFSDLEKISQIYEGSKYSLKLRFNYYIYKSLKNNRDMEHFKSARKEFFENKKSISRKEKNYFYSDLINILHGQAITHLHGVKEELFFILKSCLEDKAYKLSEKEFMNQNFYRMVILTSNSLKEFEWAEMFIDKYTAELSPQMRDNMLNYSKALVFYGKAEYEKSLNFVSKINYDQVFFKTDVKILMLRIYYELDLYEQALYLADSFKHNIKKSKVLNRNSLEGHNNYLKYYIKLFKLKNDPDINSKNEADMFKNQIKDEVNLIQRSWLIENADLIISKLEN